MVIYKWAAHRFLLLQLLQLLLLTSASSLTNDICFIILGQKSQFDNLKTEALKESIVQQSESLGKNVEVVIPVKDFPDFIGYWTVWTIFSRISSLTESKWYAFLESDTAVRVAVLLDFLKDFPSDANIFLGHGLYDESPTIIHHFYGFDSAESSKFLFPDFAAGFAISRKLFTSLTISLNDSTVKPQSLFAIDPKHEFALLVYKQSGTRLSSYAERFCLHKSDKCASFFEDNQCVKEPTVSTRNLFVSVKTFSGYHNTRIPVIKRTWAASLPHIAFFSDAKNYVIPTIDVGVSNTERGHCAKTFVILKHFVDLLDEEPNFAWLLVADDDTLIGVPRLLRLLSCYDHNEKVIIGERYGYGFSSSGNTGYDYPTGGSGMVFSPSAARALVSNCNCPENDSPDDMIIGLCARGNGITVIHNAAFHQARPIDYPEAYIRRLSPISFHKFDDVDPYQVYMEYLFEPPARRLEKTEL